MEILSCFGMALNGCFCLELIWHCILMTHLVDAGGRENCLRFAVSPNFSLSFHFLLVQTSDINVSSLHCELIDWAKSLISLFQTWVFLCVGVLTGTGTDIDLMLNGQMLTTDWSTDQPTESESATTLIIKEILKIATCISKSQYTPFYYIVSSR